MLADRYSRKWLMLSANVASLVVLVAVLVFGLLESLTSVYVVAVVMVAARAVFDPAEYAYLPNIFNGDYWHLAVSYTSIRGCIPMPTISSIALVYLSLRSQW